MQIENKCLLCGHYTDENYMDECKIWACGGMTGTPDKLVGCSSFLYKEELVEYRVKIDNIAQTYVFTSDLQLTAFINMQVLEHNICRETIHVEKVVKIVNGN